MKIVFATNNFNKLIELQDLISSNIKILSLDEINCTEKLIENHILHY